MEDRERKRRGSLCSGSRVLSTGGGVRGGGGGKILPQTLPKFLPIKSCNVLAKNLSAISQLQGPRTVSECLRTTLTEGSKFRILSLPLENCGLC